ncbi:MAG: polysaccharide biosynthesis protein [Clostridiales bacterium]|nr:polysaccharide biosynthesis protein [Clostridiales bacterium]
MSRKSFFRETLILTGSGILCRVLGFFYRIFLSRHIGAEGIGLYHLTLPIQSVVLSLSAAGISPALSRLIASLNAGGKEKDARDCLVLGCAVSALLCALAGFFLYQGADFFAIRLLGESRTAPLIRLLAAGLPFNAIHTCIASDSYARKKAVLPSAAQLLEQVARIAVSILLWQIFLAEGREVTAVIAAGGALAGEALSALFFLFSEGILFQRAGYSPRRITDGPEKLRRIFFLSTPISANRILLSLLTGAETVLIPQMLVRAGMGSAEALQVYGIFTGMALPLILFPSTVTGSASVMLMPSVAEFQAQGYKKRIRSVTGQTLQACLLLGFGCFGIFFLFGETLGRILFSSATAGIYIRTMSYMCPFLYLNTALSSILHGLGKPGRCLIHSALSVLTRIGFVVFAVPSMGIRGCLYGILCGELLQSGLHLWALRNLTIDNPPKIVYNESRLSQNHTDSYKGVEKWDSNL